MHNGVVPRAARFQVVLSVLLASALATQALATCSIWMLAASSACCPLHTGTPEASVVATCCDTDGAVARAPAFSIGILAAPQAGPVEPFLLAPAQTSLRVGFAGTLPVAAHGHAVVPLSALLI